MTRRRWIADEVEGSRAALTGYHAEHLIRVLRARVGQEFDIAAADTVRRGKISAIGDRRVEFELGESVPAVAVPDVTLVLAIFKFDRMEWAIEKATELGVAQIVPVVARRTERHLAAAATKRAERWRRLVVQASEQSRRAVPPRVEEPLRVAEALRLDVPLRILLSENERGTSLKDVLAALEVAVPVALAIGPEGGWTSEEEAQFAAAGWTSASLGPSILRAETATIAALAVVMAELS